MQRYCSFRYFQKLFHFFHEFCPNTATEAIIRPVVRGVQGLYRDNRSLEGPLLRHKKFLSDDGLVLRLDIEIVLCTIGLDIPIALRGDGEGTVEAYDSQPPAVIAGKLVNRPE